MAGLFDLICSEDIQKVANLQVLARQVVEGFCTGLHRSPHKGFSVEFREHRPYVPGDEIRHLDWKIFGRTDRFFIREYEEETNLRATLLVDVSGSMAYGSNGLTKAQYAVRLAACLAYLLLNQGDGVGLVLFDHAIRRHIPPRARPGHLRVLAEALATAEPGGETDLGQVFRTIAPRLHRRGLLIILSDTFGQLSDLVLALAGFRHERHEVILFQIWDPEERDFSFKSWTRFECLERDGRRIFVDPSALRTAYLRRIRAFQQELAQGCQQHRVDLVPLVTSRPYADALAAYLAVRYRRA